MRVDLDRKFKLKSIGVKITFDAGWPAYRELDKALGMTVMIESAIRSRKIPIKES